MKQEGVGRRLVRQAGERADRSPPLVADRQFAVAAGEQPNPFREALFAEACVEQVGRGPAEPARRARDEDRPGAIEGVADRVRGTGGGDQPTAVAFSTPQRSSSILMRRASSWWMAP